MSQVFVKKIPGREVEVSTRVSGDGEWEIMFRGEEARKAMQAGEISDVVCRMWDKDSDPEGKEAEKVHNKAAVLLEAGTDIKKTILEVEAMIEIIVDKIYG